MFPSLLTALALGAPQADGELKKRAEELVGHLGDPVYRDREKAARELLDIGYPARDAVLAGQRSADAEVSDRCKKLYPAIWRADLDRRVGRFLADPDGPIPDDLPGAARWLKTAGDGKESRLLYASVVRAHPELLLEVELNPDRLRPAYVVLARDVYDRVHGRPPTAAANRPGPDESEVLAFLFLGATGDVRPTVLAGPSSVYFTQFLTSPHLATALAADPPNVPVRRLFAAWLEKERYSVTLRRAIDLATQHKVRECAPAILKVGADPGTMPSVRATALLGFARLGTKDDLPALEPLLKSEVQIGTVVVNQERWTVQARDVALGAAVLLAGQDPADFGFARKPPNSPAFIGSYTAYAFESDEARAAAHQKWREWVVKNLKK
jgi:hypothetical protein